MRHTPIPIEHVSRFSVGSRFRRGAFRCEIVRIDVEHMRASGECFTVITARVADDSFPRPFEAIFSPDGFVERFAGYVEVCPVPVYP